ncbi:MAG: hypothetical protein AB7O44_33140 [Hyphomicrobiaceae bacterium]
MDIMDIKNAACVDRRLAKWFKVGETLGLKQGAYLILSSTNQRLPLSTNVDNFPLGGCLPSWREAHQIQQPLLKRSLKTSRLCSARRR